MLVLDSGAVSGLAARTPRTAARIGRLRSMGLWPPVVPTPVLIEVLQGHDARDAAIKAAIEEADKGIFVSSEAVDRWMESWGTDNELSMPEPDIFPDAQRS